MGACRGSTSEESPSKVERRGAEQGGGSGNLARSPKEGFAGRGDNIINKYRKQALAAVPASGQAPRVHFVSDFWVRVRGFL